MAENGDKKQLWLAGFEVPFEMQLDSGNRWGRLAKIIPWREFGEAYEQGLKPSSRGGRPPKPSRLVIGAVIIKHKLGLSDEETVRQIQENPYLQFFCGLPSFSARQPFAPSLSVEIRKRMGETVFDQFQDAIIDQITEAPEDNPPETEPDELDGTAEDSHERKDEKTEDETTKDEVKHQGKLIIDATACDQMIRFPTDIALLNEAREISERLIDRLYKVVSPAKKPRTYRQKARKDFLGFIKQRRPRKNVRRTALRKQLQYLRRNLGHISRLCEGLPPEAAFPFTHRDQRQLWIIHHLYDQQKQMFDDKINRCDDRIVSIHQPHVRPIKRGKPGKAIEFGAKLSVSLDKDGLAYIDRLGWDAFNEGQDLECHVNRYKERYGYYPEVVLADTIYGTRKNRKFMKEKGIRFAGKPLGRPKKQTEENKKQLRAEKEKRREEYCQRIPIEGKFGQGKNGYGLAIIKAKLKQTSESWMRSIFLVMNLAVLSKRLAFFLLWIFCLKR